jgi:hypothetical protein
MGAIRRTLDNIFIIESPTDTPETIERKWREAFIHDGALRAIEQERAELLEALDGLEPEQAARIYGKAVHFMGFGLVAAVLLAQGLDGMTATPDEPTTEAVEAKFAAIVERGRAHHTGLHTGHIAAMLDRPRRYWLRTRCQERDRRIHGDPPPARTTRARPEPPVPLEVALSEGERRRLGFLRWRIQHGGIDR